MSGKTPPKKTKDGHMDGLATRKMLAKVMDSLYNEATGRGMFERDPSMQNRIAPPPLLVEEECSNLYIGSDVAKNVINIPLDDIWRSGVILKTDDAQQTNEISKYFEDLGAWKALKEFEIAAQVYGGAILWPGISGGGRLENRLAPDAVIKSIDFFEIFNRFEVNPLPSGITRRPEAYDILAGMDLANAPPGTTSAVHGLHESRVIRRVPITVSRRIALNRYMGWGPSFYVALWQAIRGYTAAWDSTEDLLRSFAQAYFKMKGLAELASTNGIDEINARLDAMLIAQSTMGLMLLDSESEEYGRQSTPMTGLPDLHDKYQARLSHAARIPQTLLFGQAPSGLDATGESDIRLYYDRISALRNQEIAPTVKALAQFCLRAQNSPTKGVVPDFKVVFPPLWEATALEKAQTRKTNTEADYIYINAGVFTASEVRATRVEEATNTEIIPDEEVTEQLEELSEAKIAQQIEMAKQPVVEPNAPADGPTGARAHSKDDDLPAAKGPSVPKSGVSEQMRHKISGE